MKKRRYQKSKSNLDSVKIMNNLAFFVFLAGCILVGFLVYRVRQNSYHPVSSDGNQEIISNNQEIKSDCNFRRLLDGVCVKSESEVSPRLIGVMIGNSVEAWPLSNLSKASVVYEAPAEGNVPRFLAIFPDNEVDKVGPVRSARPYFMDFISEYGGAAYLHVGGSPDAIDRLDEYKDIFNVDEYYNGTYFWRSKDREAPHNAYTSKELWSKAWQSYKREQKVFQSWKFADMTACQTDCVTSVKVSFGSPSYISRWGYSMETKKYYRLQGYTKQLDQNGDEVSADTVIVQNVNAKVLDNIGRLQIDTVGGGTAVIFRDGYKIDGKWKKDSRTGRTIWLDSHGQEISLKSGQIWIEVASQNMQVEWK